MIAVCSRRSESFSHRRQSRLFGLVGALHHGNALGLNILIVLFGAGTGNDGAISSVGLEEPFRRKALALVLPTTTTS